VLVGQQELADRLNDPSLRQLKQRIVLRCALAPLNLQWTASYIAARLRVAGASPTEVFTKDAVIAIYEASRGIPRTIGVICENALLAGFAAQKKPVGRSLVEEACKDLDLAFDAQHPHDEDVSHTSRRAAQPGAQGAAESASRRAPSRFWVHGRPIGQQAEAGGADVEPARAVERSRLFRSS
jgi:hypothetical protein